ncbi:MAG: IS110 family transposase [Planctomycetia bacterium]|nr:IS110 family transposase [Planctomycetia bacterium]
MQNQRNLAFEDIKIYIGIDVHKKSWTVSIYLEEFEHKTFTQPPKPAVLKNYLHSHFPKGNYYVAYEAGFSGFWIYDALKEMDMKCIVVHPSDIPTTDLERRRKSDLRDARKLSRSLRAGELSPIYVPPKWAREDRGLLRLRESIVKDGTRLKNRIKGLLHFHGLSSEHMKGRRWSGAFIGWLESLTLSNNQGTETLKSYIRQLNDNRTELTRITREIRRLSKTERYRKSVSYLVSIPGIGLISTMIWLTELVDIQRFKSNDHLSSYVGLVPSTHSSGETDKVGRLDKRGNKKLRTLLIENSWVVARKDTGMLRAYTTLCKRMQGNKAIIRIARKLLNRIRFVLLNETQYEVGLT